MAERERKYEWFLEPRGDVAYTNKVIANNIGCEENDGELFRGVLCADGKIRKLWRCPSGIVFALWNSRQGLGIKLRVFNRELPDGKIRDCTTWYRNLHKKRNFARNF